MTKLDVLRMVSQVFQVKATAVEGFWNVQLNTIPPRDIVFSADWIARNIEAALPDALALLEERLRAIPTDGWYEDKRDGRLFYLVN